ncbi:bifunctional oligoribonuclease/PAP phosphatase NrnA [Flavobacterium sp. ASW18X]|uniref:DHH family phosphoesterase n=1 Tax=Flavobacterium sp. ASW18X TaxID=2572595 RepID=UPI0010ADCC5A|nr:bifunctional oligoribonuclease/PAP phosphatase NrnA [Flavobacterium sp. ASW18X]TKD62464.1 bifunctional oligoribonuclease/PAP phosphatase NrnA [Flavobacterium sp. ASW18X]
MNTTQVKQLKALLAKAKNIIIVPHKNPDGDAIGSTLGLQRFLASQGHDAQIIVPNDFPKFLKWIPGSKDILIFEYQQAHCKSLIENADLIFTLDFNHFSRTGQQMEALLTNAKAKFVMIDHHQQPADYADITYSDTSMSSTCEMVYNVVEAFNAVALISPEMATSLYTGILTDTGSFKYRSTTSRTHRVIASLLDQGAEGTTINQNIFDNNSPSRLHLLGTALNNLVILQEYRTAFITMTQEELDKHNYTKGDTEGFVNYGLTLEGIIFAVIFIENKEEGIIKISFRSVGDFSVNQFARKHFNGGGHDNAAGGRSDDSMEATVTKFKKLLEAYKTALHA